MANLVQYSMNDKKKLNLAWQELDRLISLAEEQPISTAVVKTSYNTMFDKECTKMTFPQFIHC